MVEYQRPLDLDDALVEVLAQQQVDPRRNAHAVEPQHVVEAVRDASHAQKLAGDRSEMVDAQAGAVDDQIRGVVDKRDRRLVDGVLVKSNQISYISKDTRKTRNALILSGGRGLSKPGRRRHSTFAPFSDT